MAKEEKAPKGEKIQSFVPSFQRYVIQELIGIKGTNESDVVGKIVDEWITRNIDFLEKAEITIKKWRKGRGK